MVGERVSSLDYANSSILGSFRVPMEYHHFVDSTKGTQWVKDSIVVSTYPLRPQI
jgi:hypothetical protein